MEKTFNEMIPLEVREVMHRMAMARFYNNTVGANITHQDVAEWGFRESLVIESAIRVMSKA